MNENGLSMWWMWHGPVGHWVVNQSPGKFQEKLILNIPLKTCKKQVLEFILLFEGQHADDIILSTKADVTCPDEVANWEDTTGATNVFICAEDVTS